MRLNDEFRHGESRTIRYDEAKLNRSEVEADKLSAEGLCKPVVLVTVYEDSRQGMRVTSRECRRRHAKPIRDVAVLTDCAAVPLSTLSVAVTNRTSAIHDS